MNMEYGECKRIVYRMKGIWNEMNKEYGITNYVYDIPDSIFLIPLTLP